ncbi:MAG: DMT family transporter [Bacteroidales bacterium]|nr:DMT family transporter [Bacteroidales bacterium]
MKGNFWYHLLAIAIVAVWGLTFISTKVLIEAGLTPSWIFTLRFILAYAGMWFFSSKKLFCKTFFDEFLMILLGVSGGSMYFLAENTALSYTLTTNVSFLVCTTPLVTALAAVGLEHTRLGKWLDITITVPPRWLFLGSMLALAGAGLVIFNGKFVLDLNPVGDLLAISAAILWMVYSLILPTAIDRYSSAFVTRKVFFWGLVTIIPFLFTEPLNLSFKEIVTSPLIMGNVLFLGLIASLACFALWNIVMRKLGAVKGTNYIYLNPVFTLIGSVIILREPFTWLAALGACFILLGVIASNHKGGRELEW